MLIEAFFFLFLFVAMVVAFNVTVQRIAERMASMNGIHIYSANIIYNVLDKVKQHVIDLLPKVVEKRVTGEADVLQIFDIQGKRKTLIKVAGCRVTNGIVEKGKKVRVMRNGSIIHEGLFHSSA